jgi:hypothetical protein
VGEDSTKRQSFRSWKGLISSWVLDMEIVSDELCDVPGLHVFESLATVIDEGEAIFRDPRGGFSHGGWLMEGESESESENELMG